MPCIKLPSLSVFFTILFVQTVCSQQPHVDTIFKTLDSNSDGFLTKDEASKSARYARQFPRWDSDGNGKVSKKDIVAFRAKFGIAADGSTLRRERNRPSTQNFTIPDVSNLIRVDKQTKLPRSLAANSQYVLKTSPHAVSGKQYFILTDHDKPDYLDSLRRLAKHRNAKIISVKNLATLYGDRNEFDEIRKQLADGGAKYVAISPRLDSFRENMLLSIWELLSSIDSDPELDCFPGLLLASNPKSFSKLIEQSIQHEPITNDKLSPFAINQVQNSSETRSLQKSGILRKHFQTAKISTPIVAIYGKSASAAPRLTGHQTWNLTVESKGKFIKQLPVQAQASFDNSNLVIMHGHGIPGMSCSLDVEGLPKDMTGKILMTGSCFSAVPVKSDLASMRQAPGGYQVEKRDAFVVRAIDRGSLVAFGHQRLSSGFPYLYPTLESWMKGQTVGEAYQQLINALIRKGNFEAGKFVVPDSQKTNRRLPQNSLLYVVIGDPAVQPFARFEKLISPQTVGNKKISER